jgi:SOS-response transcriptional repressor LexA
VSQPAEHRANDEPLIPGQQSMFLASAEWIRRTGADLVLKVTGDYMVPAGINNGDHVGISRTAKPKDGDIIVARTPAGDVLKTYRVIDDRAYLLPASPDYNTAEVVGLVVGVIHFRP